ncbi:hypothetical protein AK812_SmicGene15570 [Symbiodinium microadriaticum]|uniref:Uncharacterized protein n=1 Tax=Symbiodinium microadriaticum TaxID=2951 RepID=A0A1Q9E2M8_SYMMI|nr:hypothetical protein AK812_SmicGene15570 [Symbiodinium microadriaticum]CAE7687461.1 unnamed protein product [Symbiodinium sp. KB8]
MIEGGYWQQAHAATATKQKHEASRADMQVHDKKAPPQAACYGLAAFALIALRSRWESFAAWPWLTLRQLLASRLAVLSGNCSVPVRGTQVPTDQSTVTTLYVHVEVRVRGRKLAEHGDPGSAKWQTTPARVEVDVEHLVETIRQKFAPWDPQPAVSRPKSIRGFKSIAAELTPYEAHVAYGVRHLESALHHGL